MCHNSKYENMIIFTTGYMYLVSGQVVHVSLTKGRNGFLYLQTFYASFHRRINLPAPFLSLKKWQTSAGREKWYYTMYVWVTENLAIEQQLKVEAEKCQLELKQAGGFQLTALTARTCTSVLPDRSSEINLQHTVAYSSVVSNIFGQFSAGLYFHCPLAHTNDGPVAKFELNMTA